MASDGSIVIDVILDDGTVAKGVANLDKQLGGIKGSGEKAALGIGKIVAALGLVALGSKAIGLVKDSLESAFKRIDTFERFERVMTTVTGSVEETQKALKRTGDIVTGTAYTLDGAASAVQNFVTRGMTVDQATKYVEAFGDAVAFYGDGSQAQFENVQDALSKMVTAGKVGMDQLNRLFDAGIDAVGMYAKATGRDAASVQKDLSAGKISAEKFIDTVSTAMMEGTNGVVKIAGAAKEAGASWGSTFGNMRTAVARGVANIITNIDEMLTQNGLPDMRAIVATFGQKFEEVLKKVADSIPTVVEKIKEIYNTLKPWIPLIQGVALAIGSFVGAIATMNTTIAVAAKVWKALSMVFGIGPWGLAIAGIIAAAVLIYKYWEPISKFFVDLWEKVKIAGIAVWDWFKGVWQRTVEQLKGIWNGIIGWFTNLWNSVVQTVVDVGAKIAGVWTSITNKVKEVWGNIVTFFTTIFNEIMRVFEPMIGFFQRTWGTIVESAKGIFGNIVEFLTNTWANIQQIAAGAWELIKNVILGPVLLLINLVTGNFEELRNNASAIWSNMRDALGQIFGGLINIIGDYAKLLWDNLNIIFSAIVKTGIDYFTSLWQTLVNIWNVIRTAITNTLNAIWNYIKQRFIDMVNTIRTNMTNAWNAIKNTWNNIRNTFVNMGANIVSAVVNAFRNLVNSVRNGMTNARSSIRDGWNSALEFLRGIDLWQIGRDIIQGLINGVTSQVRAVGKAIKDVTDQITGTIKKILQIKSPSRLMRDLIGKNMMLGWKIGIEKEADAPRVAISRATGSLLSNLKNIAVPNLINGLTPAIAGGTSSIVNNNYSQNYDDGEVITLLKQIAEKDPNLYVGREKLGEVMDQEQARRTGLYGRRVQID